MTTPEDLERIRATADQLGAESFLELLRWHRAVAGLSDLDWSAPGSWRRGVTDLTDARGAELLHDLRRAARDPRRHRHGADGKPAFGDGRTLGERHKRT